MTSTKPCVLGWAIASGLLLLPAVVFLLAVVLQVVHSLPAVDSVAHDIVQSFAGKRWTLWGPLTLQPVFAIVFCTIGLNRHDAAGLPRPFVLAALRVLATLILAVVIAHMAAN